MKQKPAWYVFVGFIVGVLVTYAFTSNAINNRSFGMMGKNTHIDSEAEMLGNIDQHFIEQMIPHHDGAIAMAELALEKATHPEIKTLANSIIKSQSKENYDMKQWYKTWFGSEVQAKNTETMGMGRGMMRGGMMDSETDIEELKEAEDFDKAFLEEMIPHHQMAIMMANMLVHGTNRLEMKQLGENIIKTQAKEIEEMRGWYKEWGY